MAASARSPEFNWAKRLTQAVYLNRVFGFTLTYFMVFPLLADRSSLWHVLLFLHSLVIPHLQYRRSIASSHPLRCEVEHLFFDHVILGLWVGLTGFPVLFLALYGTTSSLNTVIMGGVKVLLRGALFLLLGMLLGGLLNDWVLFTPLAQGTSLAAAAGLILYCVMVGAYSYSQARALIQVKRHLRRRNQELLALDGIVQALNRETQLAPLLQTLLEKGMQLFPNSERAFFLECQADGQMAKPVASMGFEGPLPEELAAPRWKEPAGHGGIQVYGPKETFYPLDSSTSETPSSAATVVLPVHLGSELAGILVFENERDVSAFSDVEADLLSRFQNHAITAVGKVRMLRDLQESADHLRLTQKQLLDSAHWAGKAEIAISVLHNLGNALNSVRVSSALIQERLRRKRLFSALEQASRLLREKSRQPDFFTRDALGSQLPVALTELSNGMQVWLKQLTSEFSSLEEHLQRVLEIVRSQEIYVNAAGYSEELEAHQLLEEAVSVARPFLLEAGVEVVLQLEEGLPPFISQRSRLLQVLVSLLKNAAEALAGSPAPRIELQVQQRGGSLLLRVRDNGPGVAPELRDRIFQFGFSTRPQGNGFGLHYGSTMALDLGGKLELEASPTGASFLLTLPLKH